MDGEVIDRRRLKRPVPWSKVDRGVYATDDSMHVVRRAGRRWYTGVRQPYHGDGEWDFTSNSREFRRLRDAQADVESAEAERPRISTMQTTFHDRRGL